MAKSEQNSVSFDGDSDYLEVKDDEFQFSDQEFTMFYTISPGDLGKFGQYMKGKENHE